MMFACDTMPAMNDRAFKDQLYPEFARVAQALASERRLEIIDMLAQAPARVEAIAASTGMTVANASQHLQVLRHARLVESERQGTTVTYRLASPEVLGLWLALRDVAERRLPLIDQLRREFSIDDDEVQRSELREQLAGGRAVLIDVRPANEFAHGHIPGALSLPLDELDARLGEMPRDKRIIAYCRGAYCLSAGEAVERLRERGYDAIRLEGGWPEWINDKRSPAP